MTSVLDAILAPGALSVLFQPILSSADRSLFAVEALARGPVETNMQRADVLFEYVRRKHEEVRVDRACVAAALAAAAGGSAPRISINVHASTVARDESFADFVCDSATRAGIPLRSIIIEIIEHLPAWDGDSFFATLMRLRSAGISIALDDVGLGYSNYRMLLDTRPDIIKLDRYIVAGCSSDRRRHAVVRSIQQLAKDFGSVVVAEGIESEDDLATIADAGIWYAQGYLLGRPGSLDEAGRAGIAPATTDALGI